jgi:hypothetical protein
MPILNIVYLNSHVMIVDIHVYWTAGNHERNAACDESIS